VSGTFLLRRALHSIIVLFGTLTLVFILVRLVPADPVIIMAGQDATPQEIQGMRRALGFDRPIYIQYGIYLANVARGNLGVSLRQHRPAASLVMTHFPVTAQLAVASMALAILIGAPVGMMAAVKRGSALDTATIVGALLGQSMPTFWLGIMLILVFAVRLHWLPTSGYGGWRHMVLPTITLGLYMSALIARMNRSSMLEVLDAEYLRTARSKGLPQRSVLITHALRNALIPVVTVIGLQTGNLLGGAVITETVFAWPGIGSLAVGAITVLDYPVVQAVVILSGIVFVLINLLLDVVYVRLDPRIQYS
jgi:ABC-type dipeptide/oligopeptide/nickel transport system permease component